MGLFIESSDVKFRFSSPQEQVPFMDSLKGAGFDFLRGAGL